MDIKKKFGIKLREIRTTKGFTQEKMAEIEDFTEFFTFI